MQVSEILAVKGQALFTIAPNKTLADAVAVMTGQDVGSLVVFEGGRMVGMLTFREVLKALELIQDVRSGGLDICRPYFLRTSSLEIPCWILDILLPSLNREHLNR